MSAAFCTETYKIMKWLPVLVQFQAYEKYLAGNYKLNLGYRF